MIIKDQIDTEELRRIKVPAHRMNPLKNVWDQIVGLMTSKMGLLLRMNL